jgi:CRISPR-associated Csx14 family protein
MAHVLVATLGESPVVVSAMINVLRDQENIALDKVQILYPDEPNERWIGIGYELLEEHLQERLAVEPLPLPFDDARTEEHSLMFMRLLSDYLQAYESAGDTVYLSIAGGRKHTSALMAILPQFFPCVRGLYHLHDLGANNARLQRTIEQLDRLQATNRQRYLDPPAERFRLVELPCQHLTNAPSLLQWLKRKETVDTPPPIPISPAAESFYGDLFYPTGASPQSHLEVWLTRTAYEQYCELQRQGASSLAVFDTYLKEMAKPEWYRIPKRIHDQATDANPTHLQESSQTPLHHFTCKKAHTAERVFCYTQPHAITASHRAVQRVVITRFSVHTNARDYDMSLQDWVQNADVETLYRPSDLPARSVLLIGPLGDTPMIVTQAYTLLNSPAHHTPPLQTTAIHIVYPQYHVPADNGATLLRSVCDRRGIPLHSHPLPIEDLDGSESISAFIAGLKQAIAAARQQSPGDEIALLLSGGRKGMSALALYVAQTEGITRVYHTTIPEPHREQEIEQRTSYDALRSLSTSQQAELLFLDAFSLDDFTLITLPVISFVVQQAS